MTLFYQRALLQLPKLTTIGFRCHQKGMSDVLTRHASTKGKIMEKYVQVLPIIKLSPSYTSGKILLGKWNFGNYKGRYTGIIEKLAPDATLPDGQHESSLENFAKALVPSEIRDFVGEVKCHAVFHFDGPPDSMEFILVASISSLVDINKHLFSPDYPYQLEWFDINKIPFDKMPADDRIWYPSVIQGKLIKGSFHYGGLDERELKSYELEEVKDLDI